MELTTIKIMILGVSAVLLYGLILYLVRSCCKDVEKVLKDNQLNVCPSCQEELVIGDVLCPACEAFIAHLQYCDKHEVMYDGAECPKCKYGDFVQIR